jgi:hypothetical protein
MAGGNRANADERLAAELAVGKTIAAAATAAGISERTATRRMADPTFRARLTEARAAMIATAANKLASGMTAAADVLRELLASADEHVQHKAAVKLIELSLRVGEAAELQQRVADLEVLIQQLIAAKGATV